MSIEMLCLICGKSSDDHRGVVHQFQGDVERLEKAGLPRAPVKNHDSALRLLLMDKGLITLEELESTERRLKAAGLGGADAGNGQNDRPHRKVRDTPQA